MIDRTQERTGTLSEQADELRVQLDELKTEAAEFSGLSALMWARIDVMHEWLSTIENRVRGLEEGTSTHAR